MNIRDLEYLVAVADLRNFSKAADHCCISQPTLSAQLKKLEESLGVTLFERNNRRVLPTEVGEGIVASARRILSEVHAIEDAAKAAHDPFSGKIRIGAFPTLASYFFPHVVPRLTDAMPNLRMILIEEKTDTLLEKLRLGQIDAAFLALPVHDTLFEVTKLFEDPFYLAVPSGHPLAHEAAVDPDVLYRHTLLLLEEGHCLRDQSLEVCSVLGASEEPDCRATSLETLREMVKARSGITLMPQIAIQKGEDRIAYVPFEGGNLSRTIGLVWRKTSKRRQVFEKIISECTKAF